MNLNLWFLLYPNREFKSNGITDQGSSSVLNSHYLRDVEIEVQWIKNGDVDNTNLSAGSNSNLKLIQSNCFVYSGPLRFLIYQIVQPSEAVNMYVNCKYAFIN